MNYQISKRDRIKQITALVLRKFNLNEEKSEQSLNSFSELEALVCCCEELPLSSLAYQKDNTKELVDLSSADMTAEEVKCDAADTQGETFSFIPERLLCGQREMRQMLLI